MRLPQKLDITSGWGNYPREVCTLYRPEKRKEIPFLLGGDLNNYIPRGAGKSYGDAAQSIHGTIIMERLNRFISFDQEQGIIRAESGVTLSDIIEVAAPKGWFLPVIPGTKFVTLGGAFASNVHGKNHFALGEFAKHVIEISLRLPNNEIIRCSRYDNSDIFWATAGGMGLTGIIEEVTLKLIVIETTYLKAERIRVGSIEAMIELFRDKSKSSEYMVGWIDHFKKEDKLGSGIFESATHANPQEIPNWKDGGLTNYKNSKSLGSVPFFAPGFLLNRRVMAFYNYLRFRGTSYEGKKIYTSFDSFFHPLDRIGNWNRLYGHSGLLQYQCLIPETPKATHHIKSILKSIQGSGEFSYLAVIKYHGAREGILSFSDNGFSLALDFPVKQSVLKLLDNIDQKLCDIGGKVYLAKDARLKPEYFIRMYASHLPKWRQIVKEIDPSGKMQSSLSKRLHMRED